MKVLKEAALTATQQEILNSACTEHVPKSYEVRTLALRLPREEM